MRHERIQNWRRALPAAALAAIAALGCGFPASAGRTGIEQQGSPWELQRTRTKRWWTDPWGHSMQEQAFIDWMTEATGGVEWMFLMPTRDVYAAHAWWIENVWDGGGGPPG